MPFTAKASKPMKIVFISTEVAPWSKTGGLGDVVGSLPVELAKRGHKVMTISPRYDQYKGAWDTSVRVDALGKQVGFFHEHKKGVDRVFVDHPLFLAKVWGKTGSKLYGKTNGADFADNQERFAMFCKAALEAPMVLPFGYGEDVCFVANDWHSGLVPVMINKVYKPNGTSRRLARRADAPTRRRARRDIFSPLFSSRKRFSAAPPRDASPTSGAPGSSSTDGVARGSSAPIERANADRATSLTERPR
jgi:hypothetical protein